MKRDISGLWEELMISLILLGKAFPFRAAHEMQPGMSNGLVPAAGADLCAPPGTALAPLKWRAHWFSTQQSQTWLLSAVLIQ